MALKPQLQQKQSQSLVMTPKLAQSIKLLQFSHVDLMEFIHDEVEKNPLLEVDTEGKSNNKREEGAAQSQPTQQAESETPELNELVSGEMTLKTSDQVADIDANLENVYDAGTSGADQQNSNSSSTTGSSSSASSSASDDDIDTIAQLGESQSLAQHLEFQIAIISKNAEERRIATYIAHGLDEDGYFRDDLSEVAQQLKTSRLAVQGALDLVQTLEPAGVGARNLVECLTIQLKDQNRFDPAMEIFVSNLHLLAKREFETLKKLCGVETDDFNDMIREIKALDPRPSGRFESLVSEVVVPDVIIKQKTDGSWAIDLNPETLPKVLIDHDYHAELQSAVDSDEGKEFISECYSNANWLTRSLDQRAQTILKVAVEIVKQQDMFFAKGVEHLKPMNLKTVAEKIKMHESTVSRVTSNKYLMCDQGTFELKYFFSSAIASSDSDDAHSAEMVKHKIKQLIDAECPKKILSDDKLVTLLQETGIEIARRTVAKYREALRIPSSVQRRREKAMMIH